ncbi:hypothetical protein [Sinorhizobium fredii]|uniref:hypothetical protein n=1 Tax=Rhizobium fredii TaxID=380 RepID=UPI003599923D
MNSKWVFNIGFVIAALLLIGIFEFWLSYRDVAQFTYSEAMRAAEEAGSPRSS